MLITLECVLLALQAVAAVRLALDSPTGIDSQSNNRLSKRSPVQLNGGNVRKCFKIKLNANGVDLNLLVDSDISDIVIPLSSSSNDLGLAIQSIPGGELVTIKYKGDEYNGVTSTAVVTIPGTEITGVNLPVIEIEKKSADIVGIGEIIDQGVFGFGYPLLSSHDSRVPAMDALYNYGVIPKNEISIQLCPYDMHPESFINIGNTDITPRCETDGNSVAWINSPSNDHFTVNIKSVLINDKPVDLPEEFQEVVENGRTLYSYLHTCFLHMRFPQTVVTALINAILDSNAITITSIRFTVEVGPNDKAILGTSFIDRLTVTFDRQNERVGFGPGCGCEVMTSGYPIISNGHGVLWPLSHVRLPEQPSTSSSGDTSTLGRSLRLGSTFRGSIRRGSKQSKLNYEKFEG
ncbi:hypothetical protein BATDEDRAFT_91075 [Batrachochytrium dendrobatidis JAM81]|uniref:Peptidase A1 domain-containing protein n=1 Tax=Batrachochytrium dendrobatidis (strain JAM81 / FGSC 10211) TaxID=684364 RepID=F4P9R6_BATDJ|nr:uncharacterized protein BATDEDRAFT_91075 [Batrachochytrium dendrobatidis JAM81]EGF77825.1 hypothetical protein BATDEDRAFT_91075 [Batrachochytrium dendrobatidis JAM81]|eukprot:XP_006681485.1 hypothetical protein BATDEDRAFT_91075 [Batrachochytrium dendrobatidis JAM81]